MFFILLNAFFWRYCDWTKIYAGGNQFFDYLNVIFYTISYVVFEIINVIVTVISRLFSFRLLCRG